MCPAGHIFAYFLRVDMHVLNIKSGLKALLLASMSVFALNASADIVISGTRVIYPESAKDVTVSMDNRGTRPLLVQTWLDDGRDTTNPSLLYTSPSPRDRSYIE